MSDVSIEPKVADLERLEKVVDKDGTIEMCQMFLEDTRGIIERLTDAVQTCDCEKTREIAHMLKGCCKSVIAEQTAQLCAEMEGHARDGDLQGAAALLASVSQSFADVHSLLVEYVATSQA